MPIEPSDTQSGPEGASAPETTPETAPTPDTETPWQILRPGRTRHPPKGLAAQAPKAAPEQLVVAKPSDPAIKFAGPGLLQDGCRRLADATHPSPSLRGYRRVHPGDCSLPRARPALRSSTVSLRY